MNKIEKYIQTQLKEQLLSPSKAMELLKEIKDGMRGNKDVAIIGAACRLPMSEDTDEFWDNIINGRNCFVTKPPEKLLVEELFKNPYYADLFERRHWEKGDENVEKYVGGFIKDFDKFDYNFFNIPPREAKYIAPQQRVFMETAWSAVEDAGYSTDNFKDTSTGVFVGRDGTNADTYVYHTAYDALSVSGNWTGFLASRINYYFNLKGPSLVVDTACSSGLVALHEACKALNNDECKMAIAGGISIGAGGVDQEANEDTVNEGVTAIISNDNTVRTFDRKSTGTVFSEGSIAFLLKPLQKAIKDNDNIYAIIKGSSANSDGASNGLTAPNPQAQEAVVIDAWNRANINPADISFIETHGTGTLLGDPIEITGLKNAFERYTMNKQFCGVGSVKTNIGHTVGASGAANVLKVILAMKNEVMPATLNFTEPNPHIDFVNSPVYVVDKPVEWKTGDKKRIAGVSSWGFTGTNCHMVIEQPPLISNRKQYSIPRIFTISAVTETAMKNFIKKYYEFFIKKDEMNMDDISFTASTGRGHYAYRAAILAYDFSDLKKKIEILYNTGLNSNECNDIYFGMHKVVSSRRKQIPEGYITEENLEKITSEADDIVKPIKDSQSYSKNDITKLKRLCYLYIQGANIQWNQFYTNIGARRISIPTYPFDRISVWGEKRNIGLKDTEDYDSETMSHEIIERCIVESQNVTIYKLKFDLRTQWPLQEHVILGQNIVSGTTLVDILKEAFNNYYKTHNIMFKNIYFKAPLRVSQDAPEAEALLEITKESGSDKFIISSKISVDGEEQWLEHVSGNACIHTDNADNTRSIQEILDSENTEEFASYDVSSFGERWNCVDINLLEQTENNETYYTFVSLPDKYEGDLEKYSYHPGMLDDAVNMVIFQVHTGIDVYIPFTYVNMKIYANLTKRFYSKISNVNTSNNSEVIAFSVCLADEDGRILAEIEECTVKKVNKFNEYISSNYYAMEWKETALEEAEEECIEGNVIVFADQSGIADALIKKIDNDGNTIYTVNFADSYKKTDENHYQISGIYEDYEKLINEIDKEQISKVYCLSAVDFEKKYYEADEYSTECNKSIYSLVYLVKVFSNNIKGKVDFVLVSDYSHDIAGDEVIIKPLNTAYLSMAKSLIHECPSYTFRCIDIDKHTNIDNVVSEIIAQRSDIFRLALRNNVAYTEELAEFNTKNAEKKEVAVKRDGVYLITGGTGGLGLEIAKNIGEFGDCNICLMARSAVPDKQLWDDILENGTNRKQCNLIKSLRELEGKANVVIKNGDVSNREDMKRIGEELKKEYDKIIGIVHCAGVAGDGFLYNKSIEMFNNVINPKIMGTVLLHQMIKDQEVDFFISFSSMQTFLGGPGQSDYTAANSFLDTYSIYLRNDGIPAQTINWPGWTETGMAVDYNVSDAVTLFNSLNIQTAINIFNWLIRTDITNVVPGKLNYSFISKIGIDNLPFSVSENLKRLVSKYESNNFNSDADGNNALIDPSNIVLMGKSKDEYTDTERTIALIYAGVLNIAEIDIYESFSSLGGDSIISTEVFKLLNKQFSNMLSISDIFLYPSVEAIAAHIDSLLVVNEEKEQIESFSDVIDRFEAGEADIDSIADYLNEN